MDHVGLFRQRQRRMMEALDGVAHREPEGVNVEEYMAGLDAASEQLPEGDVAVAERLEKEGAELLKKGDYLKASEKLRRVLDLRKKTYGSCAIELVPSFYEFAVCLLKIAKRESDEESRQLGLEVLSEGLYIAGQNPCDSYEKVQMHLAKAKAFLMKNEYVLAMNHYLIALPMLERFLNGSDDKKLATSYYDAAVALR